VERVTEAAALGGLLHDIGKLFRYRGEKHDELGAEIARNVLSKSRLPPDLVADVCKLVEAHHGKRHPSGVDPVPFYAVKFADWISANYREEEGINHESPSSQSHVIKSPFTYIGNGTVGENWKNVYNWTEDTVKRVLGDVASRRSSVHDVLLGLKTAMYSPPIFVISDAVSDARIPLSVHLHLTSAIASALAASDSFRAAVEQNLGDGADASALAKRLSRTGENVIELVAMDIHGIQRFIYSFTSERRAMRTAAGRSMIVSILSRVIPAIVADVYGVFPTNVLINSGGRALLVLPAKGVDLEQLSADITRSLWKNNVDVVVSLKSVPVKMSELFGPLASAQSDGAVSRVLQEKMDELWKKLRADSFSVYLRGKLIDEFRSTAVSVAEGSKQICSRCGAVIQGDPYYQDEDVLCTACQTAERIQSWWMGRDVTFPLGLAIHSKNGDYLLKAEENCITVEKPSSSAFRFLVRVDSQGLLPDIPRAFEYRLDESNNILSLEDMGSFFAVAKGDGDSMGAIFGKLASESIAKYVAFSWAMSYYFEYCLPDLLRAGKKDLQVHLVYAGGDDFIFVGKPLHVLEAVRNTLHWFEEYKQHGKVPKDPRPIKLFELPPSVSVGFALFPRKYKMLWAIKYTEDLLNAAKRGGFGGPWWRKAGFCVQTSELVAPISEIDNYIKSCNSMLADLDGAGDVTSTVFYKVVDRLYRIFQASKKSRIGLPEVKLYAETKHYIRRLQKGLQGQEHTVVEKAGDVLDSYLKLKMGGTGAAGNTAPTNGGAGKVLVSALVPFVLTYLLLRDVFCVREEV